MASWIGLAFLILLSANAVLSKTPIPYVDPKIDGDSYLKDCITSKGDLADQTQKAEKKIFSSQQCYAKTAIKFKVEDGGTDFYATTEQGQGHDLPARIKYKFGNCYDIVIDIKDDGGAIKYAVLNPDDGSSISLDAGFVFHLKRRNYGMFNSPDTMEVLRKDGTSAISKQCDAFERDMGDIKGPTLMDFEQKVEEGVPDLTLVWVAIEAGNAKYFGRAIAQEILVLDTTTSTTTTTAKPPPAPVARTSSKSSTSSPVPSTSSLPTTVAPTTDLVVEESEEEAFPWWIIGVAVGVAVVLLIILLVVGYLCCRRRRAQKSQAQAGANVGASVKKVQEKSESAADKLYFERDAKPTDPKAVSKEAASKEAASKEATSKEIASK